MKVDIPYGKENVKINVPDDNELLVPNKVNVKNQDKLIEDALENPIGYKSYDEFSEDAEKLLVIINDATRPTPTSKVLKYLLPVLSSHPDVKFLIATGVHRAPTEEEYKFILGDTYNIFRRKVIAHDARKNEDMTYLGKSKNGTEMYINKLVPEYKNILVIGSVEPHYFAGYTGGRKSFLPGVASYKTIEMNHKLALNDEAQSLSLEGNPVNEDMVDAMNVLNDLNVFSIQTILTGDHKLFAVTAGDLHKSFDAAIEYSKKIFCVPLKKKGNIVITAAPYPMDIDLYQSQKALDNGKLALEDDGVIILVSKCRTGVGEDAFLELLCKADSPKKILEILGDEYKLGYHKAAKMAQIGVRAEMWAVTDLDCETIKKSQLKPYSDIQKAVDDAVELIKSKDKKPRAVVMPFGSLTVPLLK
ncbi:general glycosylation pathway protein [Thermoplasmatales archaeon SG8-52-4]|nr:MAG: general glycosylation pathway protein [Thermoplasmatales archaeon SG8-52-4]